MNHPVILKQICSKSVFQISDRLKAFNVETLDPKQILVRQYQCKKNLKSNVLNKKSQDYQLVTAQFQTYSFFQLKQLGSSKASVYTLAERQFLESSILPNIFAEITQTNMREYLITGFRWDGILIQFICFSEDTFLLIMTNQMVSSSLRKGFTVKDLNNKIKQAFQEPVLRIINQKKYSQFIQNATEELRKLLEKHRELISELQDDVEINFNLIKYGKICEISAQQVKSRMELQKNQVFSQQMEIQK